MQIGSTLLSRRWNDVELKESTLINVGTTLISRRWFNVCKKTLIGRWLIKMGTTLIRRRNHFSTNVETMSCVCVVGGSGLYQHCLPFAVKPNFYQTFWTLQPITDRVAVIWRKNGGLWASQQCRCSVRKTLLVVCWKRKHFGITVVFVLFGNVRVKCSLRALAFLWSESLKTFKCSTGNHASWNYRQKCPPTVLFLNAKSLLNKTD